MVHAVIGSGEDAVRLKLPLRDTDDRLLAFRNSEVVLGIRPECIAEPQRRFGNENTLPVSVEAIVEITEPTGAETIAMLRLAGQRVIGRTAPDMRLPVGSRQRFSIDTRKLCLFDPTSERLIA